MPNAEITIRQTTDADIPQLCAVENSAWSKEVPRSLLFTEEHFRSHLRIFPKGQLVAVLDDTVVAYGTLERLSIERKLLPKKVKSWLETTGNGFLTTHDPNGNALFGVSMAAVPNNAGAAVPLIDQAYELMIELGCDYGFLVGRMPSYHKHAASMGPERYLYARGSDGNPIDPMVKLYVGEEFEIGGLVPNYMEDPKSLNYGVLLVMVNPNK